MGRSSSHGRHPLHEELRRVVAAERGDADGVDRDVYALLDRNDPRRSPPHLVGIEAGGERVVWHFEYRSGGTAACSVRFDRDLAGYERQPEHLGRDDATMAGIRSVEYAWVHPDYRDELQDERPPTAVSNGEPSIVESSH